MGGGSRDARWELAQPAPVRSRAATVLALQRAAGNRAVTALARQVEAAVATAEAPARTDLRRGDRGPAVELLQIELNRHLGFMNHDLLTVDGRFGPLTAGAVIAVKRAHGERHPTSRVDSAFWDTLAEAPQPDPTAQRGAGPQYERMLADGILDVTLASGFDESGLQAHEEAEVRLGLTEARGFVRDDRRARQLLDAAGRHTNTGSAELYVREGVQIGGRDVAVIVRFIAPPQEDRDPATHARRADADTSAGAARAAALAGMNESDAFFYSGHARYGAGPDLDRNWTVSVDWSRMPFPRPRGALDQYTEDEEHQMVRDLRLGSEGATGVRRFHALEQRGAVSVIAHSAGNIGITAGASLYQNELGGVLIGEATRGQEQPLGTTITDDRYRLWIFDACNSYVYEASLRATGNARLGMGELSTIETRTETPSETSAEGLLSYLDGVMAAESSGGLSRRMAHADYIRNVAVLHGFQAAAPAVAAPR